MKRYSVMIKPASSLCNLNCRYCFYADEANMRNIKSFGIMNADTTEKMLANMEQSLKPGDEITLAFQGGEPTLAGLEYFFHLVSLTSQWDKRIHVNYVLQTNGTLLNDDWAEFLKKYNFLVGVSCDILPECHNSMRVDALGNGSSRRVEQGIRLLEQHKIAYNILCTLTNQVARHPQKIWNKILQLNFHYVQFTPCLDSIESQGENIYALSPKRFSNFYNQLFSLWYKHYQRGNYRSIKLFDDVINCMAWGTAESCGMRGYCQPQMVIEADGSAYPCDFYCLDEYQLGNILNMEFQKLLTGPAMRRFYLCGNRHMKLCKECRWHSFCGGGCKRMRSVMCGAEDDTFCGYADFLENNYELLRVIAQNERLYKFV